MFSTCTRLFERMGLGLLERPGCPGGEMARGQNSGGSTSLLLRQVPRVASATLGYLFDTALCIIFVLAYCALTAIIVRFFLVHL